MLSKEAGITVEEYARREAPSFAQQHNLSLPEARAKLRRLMTSFLESMKVGRPVETPFGSGVVLMKLSPKCFTVASYKPAPRRATRRQHQTAAT